MRLDFKRLEIHSFMSFEDETFDFDAHPGMTLIRGRNNDLPNNETNGAGKSTVFAALVYTLFGETQSRIKKNENVVNKFADDKDMRLVLTFDVDGAGYKVIRGLNRGKLSYLELYSEEDNITKSSIAETQTYIEEEVIRCDLSIFLRTILLTSKQTYNFYDLKKSDKKEFVEKLFDISVFGDMYQAIHRDVLDCDKEILSRQNKLLVLNRSDEDYKARMAQYDKERKAKLVSIDESISSARASYEKLRKSNVETNSEESEKLETAVNKINDAKRKLNVSIRELEAKNAKIELAIHKLNASKASKQQSIDRHAGIMKRLCDECKPVFAEYCGISDFEREIAEITEKVAELVKSSDANDTKRAELSDKIAKFDEKLSAAEDKIRKLTEKYNKANRELILLESKISSLESDKAKTERESNPYVDLYENNAKSIADENAKLDELSSRYRYLRFAEGVVSQETLRKFIISDLIGLLNNKIKTYLMKLGAKYTVVFDSDMNYDFVTDGGSYEFGNFSAGEAMRVMVATSFAFRDFMSIRNGLNANILILDEYFDSAISAACVESILGILKEYVRDYKQNIYCISHRTEVSMENFDSVIEIQKTNDISRIAYIQ